MLFRKASSTVKDEQAVFFMTIGNNMAIRIVDFNSRLSVSKKKVDIVLVINQVRD